MWIMRRPRRTRCIPRAALIAAVLLGAATSALAEGQITETDAFQLAEAFENTPSENASALLDEVVVPASLESERVPPPEEQEPRELKPSASTSMHHGQNALPFGGAMVAIEATALLVGGATLVVMVLVRAKSYTATTQYDEEKEIDPMLQSLLYSDMDYAAI